MTGTSSLAQSHEKEESITPNKDLSKCCMSSTMSLSPQGSSEHSQEISDIPCTYQQSYAAGEFAQEKSEGEQQYQHTTLFHRLASRVGGGSITHQSSEERRDELQEGQHENNDDEVVEPPVRHLSAAGEHFA